MRQQEAEVLVSPDIFVLLYRPLHPGCLYSSVPCCPVMHALPPGLLDSSEEVEPGVATHAKPVNKTIVSKVNKGKDRRIHIIA